MELCAQNNILGMYWATKKDKRIAARILRKQNNKTVKIIYKQMSLFCMCFGAAIVPWRYITLKFIAYPHSTLHSVKSILLSHCYIVLDYISCLFNT